MDYQETLKLKPKIWPWNKKNEDWKLASLEGKGAQLKSVVCSGQAEAITTTQLTDAAAMDTPVQGQAPGSQTITLMKIGHYQIGNTLGAGTFGKVKCEL